MTDAPTPRMPEDGELLSAYLAGDLDEREVVALERRLESEPDLAARLDAMHDLLVGLRGIDDARPRPGFAERLRARLDEEHPGRPAPQDANVTRLPERRNWAAIMGAAAAAVVVLAVLGAGFVSMFGGGGTQETALEGRETMDGAGEADRGDAAQERGEAPGMEAAGQSAVPLETESRPARASLLDEGELTDHVAGLPAVRRLRAAGGGGAADVGPSQRIPGRRTRCLPEARPPGTDAAPLARQRIVFEETEALLYVFAEGERIRAVVTDRATCAILARVEL